MATLTSALSTPFTPASGTFLVQCTNGIAQLERRGTSGAAWAIVGVLKSGQALNVDNPASGVDYRFTGVSGSPVVQADQ
jgi:hypothetical protein